MGDVDGPVKTAPPQAREERTWATAVATAMAELRDWLADLSEAPDLSVGEALWRLYGTARDYVAALELRPAGGLPGPIEAVYQASPHGLYVLEPSAVPPRQGWEHMEVDLGGEPLAQLAWYPREGMQAQARDLLASLAPAIGLLASQVAQRRRMRRQAQRQAVFSRLYADWLEARSAWEVMRFLAYAVRDAWPVETVRLLLYGEDGKWRCPWTLSRRNSVPPWEGLRTVGEQLEHLRREGIQEPRALAPHLWLVPVWAGPPLLAVLVLDNALTGKPLEGGEDLAHLAALATRILERIPVEASTRHAQATSWQAQDLRSFLATLPPGAGGSLVVWQVENSARRGRHWGHGGREEVTRAVQRLLPAGHRLAEVPHGCLVAWIPGRWSAAARELADGGMAVLAERFDVVAACLPWQGDVEVAAQTSLHLLDLAWNAEAVAAVTDLDEVHPAQGGGLRLGIAVLRPRQSALWVQGRRLRLSRTGTRILWHLGTSPRPLSAPELVRRLWPGDLTVTVLNLYPHMSELRHRLAEASMPLAVHSVRGQGYVLTALEG